MTLTRHQFNQVFKRQHVKEQFEGWDYKLYLSLPEAEQEYFIQFVKEYSGQLGKLSELKIMSADQLREAWRKVNNLRISDYYKTKFVSTEYSPELTDTLTPEAILIFLEEMTDET